MGDRGGRKERLGGCCRVAMGVGGGKKFGWRVRAGYRIMKGVPVGVDDVQGFIRGPSCSGTYLLNI